MLVSISGKIGSGKDTVGKIIQLLVTQNKGQLTTDYTIEEALRIADSNINYLTNHSGFEIKKFADKLKDIICLLIGCTREQLEDQEFKNTELGEEWKRWYWSFYKFSSDSNPKGKVSQYFNSKEEAEYYKEHNSEYDWGIVKSSTLESEILTPRLLLQLLGTDCGRSIIHPNIWVNSLFSEYTQDNVYHHAFHKNGIDYGNQTLEYPNWIITDMRFPNELEAVKKRNGITIRVNRPIKLSHDDWDKKCPCCSKKEDYIGTPQKDSSYWVYNYICNNCTSTWDVFYGDKMGGQFDSVSNIVNKYNQHESETALDNAEFDYTINNDGTIEELIEKVKEILIKEKII